MTFILKLVSVAHAAKIDVNLPGTHDLATGGPVALVANFYQFALMFAGGLAFAVIVYGAVKYTISGGNAGAQSDAKEWIWGALWGIILLAGAYIILNTINPAITKLQLAPLAPITAPTSTQAGAGTLPPSCAPGNTVTCTQMNQCRQAVGIDITTKNACYASQVLDATTGCVHSLISQALVITTTGANGGGHTYGSCHFGGDATIAGCGTGRALDIGRNGLNTVGKSTMSLKEARNIVLGCAIPGALCFAEYTGPSGNIVRIGSSDAAFDDPNMTDPTKNTVNGAHMHCNITTGQSQCNCQ